MQKPKMYENGSASVEKREDVENGDFQRSQPAQSGGLSTEFPGLDLEEFENH